MWRQTGMTPWRWSVSFVAVAALVLAGCSDTSSPSRGAADISGPSSAEVLQQSKSGGVGGGNGNRGNGNDGNNGKGGDDNDNRGNGNANSGAGNGGARGRPVGELRGPVVGKAGACPTITFTVNGTQVKANGVTEYEGTSCATLVNGNLVKVEGQPLGNGSVLAREITLLTGAVSVGNVSGATVALFRGGTLVTSDVTNAGGEFEFEDVAQGTYDLKATQVGATTCTPAVLLRSGVLLVARQNEVEGRLSSTATPPTCTTLVLNNLEVKQGNSGL